MDDHLDILEETLQLQHMAPTAPDTLGKRHANHLPVRQQRQAKRLEA